MKELYLFSDYLRAHYGRQLQRIAIDLPLGCPNRENRFGLGCVYCAADGNRARHLQYHLNLAEQVARGKEYVRERYGADAPYIAYFQSFTNTYAPVAVLKRYYDEVLSLAEFKLLMISTRPDCLDEDVVALLASYRDRYEVWVELGIQTAHDRTLRQIRRGHDFASSAAATRRLHERDIKVCAHVMLGLPGESAADCRVTAEQLAALPLDAIKLHQLQVLKNTELARQYAQPGNGGIKPLNEYEYAAIAADFLSVLPEGLVIMRLCADAAPEELLAPRWGLKKSQVTELIGRLLSNPGTPLATAITADGTSTLYHPEYRQHFHSLAGAAAEAEHKFIIPSALENKLRNNQEVKLLDVGFGLGYNSFAACVCAGQTAHGKLTITALERDLMVPSAALSLPDLPQEHRAMLETLNAGQIWYQQYAEVSLQYGDARNFSAPAQEFDFIFLDGFSPETNPELWSYDFFRKFHAMLKPDGMLLTYSAAYPVRGGLLRAGFKVGETPAFGRRRGGTVATTAEHHAPPELPLKEQQIILHSTAGVPYRDPGLNHDREEILALHRKTVAALRARGIPKWAKT